MIRKIFALVAVALVAGLLSAPAGAQDNPADDCRASGYGTPSGFIVQPPNPAPGQTVTVTGFVNSPNQRVEVLIDGTIVASGTSTNDNVGAFTITFTAPDVAGTYTITVRCGSQVLTQVLTVALQATIAVTPSAVDCGLPITATAAGFAPGSSVTFVFQSDPVTLGTATADASGVARLTANTPTGITTGGHIVRASGTSQIGGAPLTLEAAVTIPNCAASAQLPITGGDTGGFVRIALLLVAIGGLLVLATRRRREEHGAAA